MMPVVHRRLWTRWWLVLGGVICAAAFCGALRLGVRANLDESRARNERQLPKLVSSFMGQFKMAADAHAGFVDGGEAATAKALRQHMIGATQQLHAMEELTSDALPGEPEVRELGNVFQARCADFLTDTVIRTHEGKAAASARLRTQPGFRDIEELARQISSIGSANDTEYSRRASGERAISVVVIALSLLLAVWFVRLGTRRT